MTHEHPFGNQIAEGKFLWHGHLWHGSLRGGHVTTALYERGFQFSYGKSSVELKFDEVQAFAYSMTQKWGQGVPQGLDYSWQIWSCDPEGSEPAIGVAFGIAPKWVKLARGFLGIPFLPNYELQPPAPDRMLELLAMKLTQQIAETMAETLSRDGRVMWGRDLAITPTGLQIHKRGQLSRELSYGKIEDISASDGNYVIKMSRRMFDSLTLRMSAINFHPDLVVFESMFETATGKRIR